MSVMQKLYFLFEQLQEKENKKKIPSSSGDSDSVCMSRGGTVTVLSQGGHVDMKMNQHPRVNQSEVSLKGPDD